MMNVYYQNKKKTKKKKINVYYHAIVPLQLQNQQIK